ncbi:unnamed protein product [Bursaphelenchus okinawaensis]|uniref:MADF domain-containing protein n=1 Tax=Bursaphelenchus okinawaensis TaxID=465554 RepID=A0A811K585_9BILA|nr:unnamed protein product [Bursaphelenchus okinawaensis]CAG9091614.1 unnamed protein product [Bursaphelenchus okinawaensis]
MVDILQNDAQPPFDLLLNIIGGQSTKLIASDNPSSSHPSPRRPQQRSRFASGDFPKQYDLSQPAKSWWRYFQKQTDTNTAMCYTCGAVFNRGPKQSTTSLSHHLKMYHREQFICIQQAKDDDLKTSKSGKKVKQKVKETEEEPDEEQHSGKKNTFNIALIKSVKGRPEIYDAKLRAGSDEALGTIWESVAEDIGDGATVETVKKRWLQIRDRYRKELKFAIRDNFAYEPKWPYFWDLGFLDEHLRDTTERANLGVRQVEKRKQPDNNGNNDFQTLFDESASSLLTNIFSACAQQSSPDSVYNEAESTDSAITSTSENDLEESESKPMKLNFTPFLNDKSEDVLEVPSKRPRKSTPTRSRPLKVESTENAGSFDWLEDEDMLFGKIVALRLRTFPAGAKKQLKISIEKLFERHERGQL